jgi:hypothetical protein
MINIIKAHGGTALSPEWDHGFDEAFTELISGDPELVREEFDALIGANWADPPEPPASPAPPASRPVPPRTPTGPAETAPAEPGEQPPADPGATQRSPP